MSSMRREPRLPQPAGKTGGARKTAEVTNFGPTPVQRREPKPDYKSRNAALALSRKRAKANKRRKV